MKIKTAFFTICFLLISSLAVNAQEDVKPAEYITPNMGNINKFIKEAYGDNAQNIINDTQKYNELKGILKNSIIIIKHFQNIKEGYYPNLSTVDLFTKYVSSYEKHSTFDPSTFNPFKYKFDFNSSQKQVFKVDGENYLIIIDWKKKK